MPFIVLFIFITYEGALEFEVPIQQRLNLISSFIATLKKKHHYEMPLHFLNNQWWKRQLCEHVFNIENTTIHETASSSNVFVLWANKATMVKFASKQNNRPK